MKIGHVHIHLNAMVNHCKSWYCRDDLWPAGVTMNSDVTLKQNYNSWSHMANGSTAAHFYMFYILHV